jgi:cysteinyl-tRNA synthetase
LDTPGQQVAGACLDSTMDLKLYDTLTREKRVFKPLDPANVRMYVCGPTVYDFAHIGNARPVIVFDVLFRLLRYLYGAEHVTYVRNITDVDDKINARAAEEYPALPLNEAIRRVTEKTDRQFHEDVAALGCLPPTFEPRATEHIAEMRALIERLVASGNAYVADDNVLFSVASDPDYGELSKRPLDEMIAGARVEVAPYKRAPMDFVLWKPSRPGEPAWPSPAGIKTPGRPGWHIECSAMAWRYLGETFDIHGGGIDLVFPHHENEIAQSRCAFHTPLMANAWMHNGFLQVEGEKMAKSAGNFVTIHELLEKWHGGAVRLAMLQTHYRQPINWTVARLIDATKELSEWVAPITSTIFEQVRFDHEKGTIQPDHGVIEALADDVNTSDAITRLRQLHAEGKQDASVAVKLFSTCCFLGLLTPETTGAFLPGAAAGATILARYKNVINQLKIAHANKLAATENGAREFLRKYGMQVNFRADGYPVVTAQDQSDIVQNLINQRAAARERKDWGESDRIRNELLAMGVHLKDNPDGTSTPEIAR